MVLEQLALLGIAGLDAYLVSTYLNAKKQAGERAKAFSYQSPQQPVAATSGVPTQASMASGDSVVLSDRLAAIKRAVGETKFADEVLPYELGALPSTSLADAARLEESPEEPVADSGTVFEAQTPGSTGDAQAGIEEKVGSLSDNVESHERKMQDLSSEFAVLEYRIAAVERMLGVEKAEQKQESEQLEIPLKAVFVQPVVAEKKTVNAKRKKKKTGKKAKKAVKKAARKIAKKKASKRKVKRAAAKKAPARKVHKARHTHPHKRRKESSTTNRVELVVKTSQKKVTLKKRRKAKGPTNRVELVIKNPAAAAKRHKKKRRKARPAATSRVELVVKNARPPAARKKRKAARKPDRVEVVLREPQKAVITKAEPKAQASPKKAASGSKDHMDIEWKGSKIKLYSGESKD